MAPQHDFILDNQTGAQFRADLNNALEAMVGHSSGPTAPTTTYAYQYWADTTDNVLKQRDASNADWIVLRSLSADDESIASLTWTLTANGTTDYIFSGPGFAGTETDPTIYVVRGQTYKFKNEMGAHPFQIQSTQGTSGTAYNDGITNNAVSNGTLTWLVRMDAPSTLYYQCTSHAAMNGTIYVLDEGSTVASIDDLSDVDTSTVAPTDGQALVWDNANSQWEPGTISGGTSLPSAQDGEALIYENGQWVAGPVIGGVSYTPSNTDANFSSVSLLLLFNGTNGSTTFTDSSSNGLTVTASGDAQISTAQYKYGGASGYFDGTGDKLNVASNSALNIGSSDDFTIEFWIRPAASTRGGILSADGDTSYSGTVCTIEWDNSNEPDKVGIWNRGDSASAYARATTPTLSLDTWYHVAFVRVGTTITVFTDGVAGATTGFSSSAFDFTNGGTAVGDVFGNSFNGYLDDLRVTKGVARYTSNFTPPTAELPASGSGGINIPAADSLRTLLGIGEYADDTAAGTGGLSSGELYYNTTSSSYVLKS